MERYNVVVLGAGSGGLTVAAGCAMLGARVALLEKHRMGGDCLNYGCVPSKAFLKASRVAHAVRTAGTYGISASLAPTQDLEAVMDYVRTAQANVAPHDSVERFTGFGVEVHLAAGRLRSAHEVVLGNDETTIWGRHIVLATGSRPFVPDLPGLKEAGYLTNETVFDMGRLPSRLLVIGGGPIGVELGQAFARLGSAVIIVSGSEHILPREDTDVAAVLAARLRREGVTILDRARAVSVERHAQGKSVTIGLPGGEDRIDVDEILVAAGRRANVEDLGLADVGIEFDSRRVHVDRRCRTGLPSVWAVGDVAGPYQFTHWAGYQARIVIRNVLFPGAWRYDDAAVPWTTFTEPEVARLGLSEDDARRKNLAYDVHRVPFDENDRALCEAEPEGFVKVLTRRGGGRILGAAVVHEHAGEILHELVLAQKYGLSLAKLSAPIHVYPTLAEANRAVGDNYLLARVSPAVRAGLTRLFAWRRR